MSVPATRWGICTAGKICQDFVMALRTLPREHHQVAAVAARDLKKAQDFAKKFEVPKAYDSYEKLAHDPDIDIVYVGSINPLHLEHCKLMLNAGKHVLCEKPLCLNKEHTTELLQLAKEKNRFFMEGYWTLFFPAIIQLRKELDSGTIGDVLAINVELGASALDVTRMTQKDHGGGAILDLGCYTLLMSQFIFKEKPERISTVGCLSEDGVDACSTTTLIYSNKRIATLCTSIQCKYQSSAYIYGSKGQIVIPAFNHPTKLILPSKTLDFPLPTSSDGPTNFGDSQGLSYEAEAVRQCLLRGETECATVPHSLSLTLAELMGTALEQLGVVYDA